MLSPRLTAKRLRALVFIELSEHADLKGKVALQDRLRGTPQVQFCFEVTGDTDMLVLFDCAHMAEFNQLCDTTIAAEVVVRRYSTSFVKREIKFAPFVGLGSKQIG